ncbi:hypothetical protein, partial [Gallintestinimicrobium sp.]|uniref:hypothetical protein n=1 Tax=Gallintestinimicrobium sp. TaxID=2981655 RepID=UPI00307E6C00
IFARQHPAPGFFIRILASDSCTSSSLPMLRMTRAEPFDGRLPLQPPCPRRVLALFMRLLFLHQW